MQHVYTHRVDAVNMIAVNMMCDGASMDETMGARLREARIKAGFKSARSAAGRFGWRHSTYSAHENGQNEFKPDTARSYARAFKVPAGWLLTGQAIDSDAPDGDAQSVEIVGYVGAGPLGEVALTEGAQYLGSAPRPVTWTITTVALLIRGSSMRPMAYDGWFVYYDENRSEITSDMIGEPCVVCLEDGRIFIKIPYPEGKGQKYSLESVNPAYDTIRDVSVKWAALVTALIPRKAAQRIVDAPTEEGII